MQARGKGAVHRHCGELPQRRQLRPQIAKAGEIETKPCRASVEPSGRRIEPHSSVAVGEQKVLGFPSADECCQSRQGFQILRGAILPPGFSCCPNDWTESVRSPDRPGVRWGKRGILECMQTLGRSWRLFIHHGAGANRSPAERRLRGLLVGRGLHSQETSSPCSRLDQASRSSM